MIVHPIHHVIFETTRSGHSNFASLFSIMKDNSSVNFLDQTLYTLDKRAHQSHVFRILNGLEKIHQISHVIFETKSQFFFKFWITLQCHEI